MSNDVAMSDWPVDSRQLMRKAKIMMVDDEPLNMEVLQVHLEGEGYSRFVAESDSTAALAVISQENPDVLLLDLVMPEVTGFDILCAMQDDRELKHIPVVVLTSSDDSETKLKALQLGATDFLAKPVDASELALRLRNTLAARAYQNRALHFDPLTELPNRRLFVSTVRRALLQRITSAAEFVLVNIQRFKTVNDSFGTDCGDHLLWEFSERLQTAFACVDIEGHSLAEEGLRQPLVARLGGDRFGVLLPPLEVNADISDDDEAPVSLALDCLQNLTSSLQMPFLVDGDDVFLNIDAGIAWLSSETLSVETLINQAETAMVLSREERSGCFQHYTNAMDAQARELLNLEAGMRTAIDNGEMFLAYQPKVDVASGEIIGAEALLRWEHPQMGLVSPMHFIPLAEDSGAIVVIGDWVLQESCRQAAAWRAAGHTQFRMAVNVSIRQLLMPGFTERLQTILEDNELPAEALVVELTENMIMEDAKTNMDRLQQLKELGVSISVDDFGTGYSSLSYLQQFPIDQLKIDRSFIMGIESADEQAPIVKAVISLAHDLDLSVVAEGVETEIQLGHLVALACDEYQGYLFSKPVRVAEFAALLVQTQLARSA